MGRPKGARNLTQAEREARQNKPKGKPGPKPKNSAVGDNLVSLPVEAKRDKVQAEDVALTQPSLPVSGEPTDPVLAAIQAMSVNIGQRLDNFDQRINDLENGRVSGDQTMQSASGQNFIQAPRSISSEMVPDSTDGIPVYSDDQMAQVDQEADAINRSLGLDKVQAVAIINTGRTNKTVRGQPCVVCNQVVERPYDVIQTSDGPRPCHSRCIERYKR